MSLTVDCRGPSQLVNIGVENEMWVVDAHGRAMNLAPDALDPKYWEFFRCIVEVAYPKPRPVGTARSDIAMMRRRALMLVQEATNGEGYVAGPSLFLEPPLDGMKVSNKPHYDDLLRAFGEVMWNYRIVGSHVHVSVNDPRWENPLIRVHTADRVQQWAHILIALTAASPFYYGRYTGHASYRTPIASTLPTNFIPARVHEDLKEWLQQVNTIAASHGMAHYSTHQLVKTHIPDPTDPNYNEGKITVELRMADLGLTVDDEVLNAYLSAALVLTAFREVVEANGSVGYERSEEWCEFARQVAAKNGLKSELNNPNAPGIEMIPAMDAIDVFFQYVGQALQDIGVAHEAQQLLSDVVSRNTGEERLMRTIAKHVIELGEQDFERVLDLRSHEQLNSKVAMSVARELIWVGLAERPDSAVLNMEDRKLLAESDKVLAEFRKTLPTFVY